MVKISVLTPCYNSVQTLQKAIDSVKTQTYNKWEHVVVDGNSDDGTLEVLNENKHLIWVSEQDSGQSEGMNKAFKMCTGDIIVYLNADDYFYPETFATIVDTFTTNPTIDIVVGNIDCYYNHAMTTHSEVTTSWKDLSVLKGRFPINPVGYFYKRKVQEKIGDFPIREHYTMDYWFLLRAFYFFKPMKTEAILGVFVFSEHNKSYGLRSEYEVQMPHALSFCIIYTPWRLFYVLYKLMTHPKRSFPIAYRIKKKCVKLLHKLTQVFR